MADELRPDPATDEVEVSADPAATQGGKSEIADDLKAALGGDAASAPETPHEQLRRNIEAELTKATDDRPRGPDGKFLPKEAAPEAKTPTQPTEPVQPQAPADPTTAAPPAWSKAVQAKWSELPAEVQAEITKREADVAKGFAKYQALRSVEPVLDWAGQTAQRLGTTGPQLVHQWGQVQEALLDPARKAQAIQYLAKTYGVELNAPVLPAAAPQGQQQTQPAGAAQNPGWVDPEVAALRERLAGFESWKSQLETQAEQEARRAIETQRTEKISAIDKFSSEKGSDGQPLRPHLELVLPDMLAGVSRIRQANPNLSDQDVLQQAYDAAIWSNPDTRSKQLEAQKLTEERERMEKARARAQAASRAAVSPASASPQGPAASAPPKGDLREQMRSTLAQLTA